MAVETYALKDTGYLNVTNSGTRATTVANSGNEVKMLAERVVYERSAGISSKANPGSNTIPEASKSSVRAPVITFSGIVKRNDGTYNLSSLKNIEDMIISKGVKLFYYTSSTDSNENVCSALGTTTSTHNKSSPDTDDGEIALSLKNFRVRCKSFRIIDDSKGKALKYSFDMVVTT